MLKKMVKAVVGVVFVTFVGGGPPLSCALEPSADSPGNKKVSLPAGMPPGLTVYGPRVDFNGTTTTLTYNVAANFSGAVEYTAQKAVAVGAKADPQSIEALILQYGASSPQLFGSAAVENTTEGGKYSLKTTSLPHYVIIPLDTVLIRDHLSKRLSTSAEAESPKIVWIEENPAIGKVEGVTTGTWADGTYDDATLRISGLAKPSSDVVIAGTVADFDDGGENRISSIATVLADGYSQGVRYSSTIHFYTDYSAAATTSATTILTGVAATGVLKDAAAAKTWLKEKDNKPALSIVYRWAD